MSTLKKFALAAITLVQSASPVYAASRRHRPSRSLRLFRFAVTL